MDKISELLSTAAENFSLFSENSHDLKLMINGLSAISCAALFHDDFASVEPDRARLVRDLIARGLPNAVEALKTTVPPARIENGLLSAMELLEHKTDENRLDRVLHLSILLSAVALIENDGALIARGSFVPERAAVADKLETLKRYH
jgi:hypothetical protein